MRKIFSQKKGVAVLMVFMLSIVLSGLVMAYLDMVGIFSKATSYKMSRYRTLYVAEAGVNRIAWYLENTAPGGTTNGTWRGTVTQALGGYNYTASAGDLPLEGAVITATSQAGANVASRAMDINLDTYWRSAGGVSQTLTFSLAINGDYTIYLSRTHMLLGGASANQFPRNYTWQVSTDGITWTTVVTRTGNTLSDVTDTFTLQQANYIRLNVTQTQGGLTTVNIGEVEIFGVVVPTAPSASSVQAANTAASAIDNNLATYWQSSNTGSLPQTFTLSFPSGSNYSLNKVRMRLGTGAASAQFPADYTWSVSSDGSTYTQVVNVSGNASTDITDTFALQSNVNYLQLSVGAVQGGGGQASIGEIDVPAVSILANCSIAYPGSRAISYYTAQNAIVDGTAPPSVNRQPKAIFGVESGQ